jgi:hypothetical protein
MSVFRTRMVLSAEPTWATASSKHMDSRVSRDLPSRSLMRVQFAEHGLQEIFFVHVALPNQPSNHCGYLVSPRAWRIAAFPAPGGEEPRGKPRAAGHRHSSDRMMLARLTGDSLRAIGSTS